MENLKLELDRLVVDILGKNEFMYSKSEKFWSGGYRILYSGNEDSQIFQKVLDRYVTCQRYRLTHIENKH